jgi:hypothetical protein
VPLPECPRCLGAALLSVDKSWPGRCCRGEGFFVTAAEVLTGVWSLASDLTTPRMGLGLAWRTPPDEGDLPLDTGRSFS